MTFIDAAAQSRTPCNAEATGADEVSATRSWLSWLVISGKPWFCSPTSARGSRSVRKTAPCASSSRERSGRRDG